MTRATTRAQIAAWLASGAVPLLSTVFPNPPKVTSEGAFQLDVGGGSGGLVFIQLGEQTEKRIAAGGAALEPVAPILGRKWREYTVTLLCFLRSVKPKAEDVGDDNDTFIEGITTRLEASRTLGTAGQTPQIFQAGEGTDTGGSDLRVHVDLPVVMSAQITQVFSTIEMTVVEVLQT